MLHEEPIYTEGEKDGITVEVAMQYNGGFASNIMSYANNIHTYEGGTHESGFKIAVSVSGFGAKSTVSTNLK